MMRFVDFEPGCAPELLTIAQTNAPALTADNVLIRVAAFGVNRADTLQRKGMYPPPPGESEILGLEVAGHIEAVGANVTGWKVGDKVFGLVPGGGYAEQVCAHPGHLMACPDGLDMAQCAGLAEVFLTAYQCIRTIADLSAGQRALIHAGASGVGLAALQLCKLFAIESAATASSTKKLALCQQAGATHTINYREQDFAAVVSECWPQGADFVLDMVAGDYLNRNLKVLKQDGMIVYLAMLAGRYADKLDMALLLAKRARIQGSTLRNRSDLYKADLIASFVRECLPAFQRGALQVNIDTVMDVKDIGQAHARMEANQTQGKLVMCW